MCGKEWESRRANLWWRIKFRPLWNLFLLNRSIASEGKKSRVAFFQSIRRHRIRSMLGLLHKEQNLNAMAEYTGIVPALKSPNSRRRRKPIYHWADPIFCQFRCSVSSSKHRPMLFTFFASPRHHEKKKNTFSVSLTIMTAGREKERSRAEGGKKRWGENLVIGGRLERLDTHVHKLGREKTRVRDSTKKIPMYTGSPNIEFRGKATLDTSSLKGPESVNPRH